MTPSLVAVVWWCGGCPQVVVGPNQTGETNHNITGKRADQTDTGPGPVTLQEKCTINHDLRLIVKY